MAALSDPIYLISMTLPYRVHNVVSIDLSWKLDGAKQRRD